MATRGRGRPSGAPYDRKLRTEELLDAAERAIKKGDGAVSIAEVAREAGFARSACYAVFPAKADLLRSLSQRHADRIIGSSWQQNAVGSPRRQLHALANVIIDWVTAEPELYAALDRDLTAQERLDHGIFDRFAREIEGHLLMVVPEDGIRPIAPIWSRLAIGGVLMVINWWIPTRPIPREELVGYIVESLVVGVSKVPSLA